jgi:hypothetical protein
MDKFNSDPELGGIYLTSSKFIYLFKTKISNKYVIENYLRV